MFKGRVDEALKLAMRIVMLVTCFMFTTWICCFETALAVNGLSVPDWETDDGIGIHIGNDFYEGVVYKISGDLVLMTDGSLWSFKDYQRGISTEPFMVFEGVPDVVDIWADGDHAFAVLDDGTLWSWGRNDYGQLGLGFTSAYEFTPKQINVAAVSLPADVKVKDVGIGANYTLVLGEDGKVYACGWYLPYQRGPQLTFNVLPYDRSITLIAAGDTHFLAVSEDGICWAWGTNDEGELGIETKGTVEYAPAPVEGLNLPSPGREFGQVVAIAAGHRFSIAVKDDGTVWGWGRNSQGQLGCGTWTTKTMPVRVSNLINVKDVAAGSQHAIALMTNGAVAAWGDNSQGQLGNNSNGERKNVPGWVISSVQAISAHGNRNLVLRSDGSLCGFGSAFRDTPTYLKNAALMSVVIDVGDSVQLLGYLNDESMSDAKLSWESGTPTVAVVDNKGPSGGLVKGLSPGVTLIEVRADNGWNDCIIVRVRDVTKYTLAIRMNAGDREVLQSPYAYSIWNIGETDVIAIDEFLDYATITALKPGEAAVEIYDQDSERMVRISILVSKN